MRFAHVAGIPIEESLGLLPPLLLAGGLWLRWARERLRQRLAERRVGRRARPG